MPEWGAAGGEGDSVEEVAGEVDLVVLEAGDLEAVADLEEAALAAVGDDSIGSVMSGRNRNGAHFLSALVSSEVP